MVLGRLMGAALTCREIVGAFGDWTRSADTGPPDTAQLDELIHLRRETWVSTLLAARGFGLLPPVERAAAIVRHLLALDLQAVEDRIRKAEDLGVGAAELLAGNALVRDDRATRGECLRTMRHTWHLMQHDPDVAAVRRDVAELIALANEIDQVAARACEADGPESCSDSRTDESGEVRGYWPLTRAKDGSLKRGAVVVLEQLRDGIRRTAAEVATKLQRDDAEHTRKVLTELSKQGLVEIGNASGSKITAMGIDALAAIAAG